MHTKISRLTFLLISWTVSLSSFEYPNFKKPETIQGVTFFLSSARSGSNLVTTTLSAITRRPIYSLDWPKTVTRVEDHVAYNRIGLDLASLDPVIYRTHEISDLEKISSDQNKLLFVTRNPKELIFRTFKIKSRNDLYSPATKSEMDKSITLKSYLDRYLNRFAFFDTWNPQTRLLVFYEDFISQVDDQLSLDLVNYIGAEPTYFSDFQLNKKAYLDKCLSSYQAQHRHRSGASAADAPKTLFYTKDISPQLLRDVDQYLRELSPKIYDKYFKRFETR